MPANIEFREILKQKEIQDSTNVESCGMGLGDLSESEITWIRLHQMFDK